MGLAYASRVGPHRWVRLVCDRCGGSHSATTQARNWEGWVFENGAHKRCYCPSCGRARAQLRLPFDGARRG